MKQVIILTVILCLFIGCGKEKQPADNKKPDDVVKNLPVDTGVVTHDNLLVRKYPDTNFGKILTKLKKGDRVKLLKKMQYKEQISKYNDYWYKIKLKNGVIGWSYGAFLIKKDADKISTEYDTIFTKEFYSNYLRAVNLQTIKNICNYNRKIDERKRLEQKFEELYKQGKREEIVNQCKNLLSVPLKFYKFWLINRNFEIPYDGTGDAYFGYYF